MSNKTEKNQKIAKILPGLIVIAFVIATIAFLSRERVLTGNPTGEVPLVMPDTLGRYKGVELWFCLNVSNNCGRAYDADTVIVNPRAVPTNTVESAVVESIASPSRDIASYVCPECGSPFAIKSVAEEHLLPKNTPIFRKLYYTGTDKDNGITATVVFSGIERRSIHKPQICLGGQGNQITNEYPLEFNTPNGGKVTLRILELQQTYGSKSAGNLVTQNSIYAYWLFNPERETDSHYKRYFQMCIDNAFRHYRPRWGYASLAFTLNENNSGKWKSKLEEFLQEFYPVITETRAALDTQRNITVRIEKTSFDVNSSITNSPPNATSN